MRVKVLHFFGGLAFDRAPHYLEIVMNRMKIFAFAVLFPVVACSCTSTRVYTKASSRLYKDGGLVSESDVLVRDEKTLSEETFSAFDEEKAEGDEDGSVPDVCGGKTDVPELTGAVMSRSGSAPGQILRSVEESERVRVESTPDVGFILYSFLGKPFVIVGASAWNALRCAGYALYNFSGGYSAVVYGDAYWKMPDYRKSKETAAAAREANRIKHYPEYHIPFTSNVITVDRFDKDVSVLSLADGEEIIPVETQVLGNKMSVSRSAAADAASTAAVAGLVGTVVTIPVSVLTWIGGAVVGVMAQMD